MELRTTEESNLRYAIYHSLFAAGLLSLIVLPAQNGLWYIAAVGTVVFGAILFCSARSYLLALFALAKCAPGKDVPEDWPRVSIIIPSYNEETVLPRTIPTVLAQEYPRDKLELIYVYESTCTDRTESIIESFAREDPRIKPVRRPPGNGGKAAVTNYGLKYATGDVIAIFDADHSLDPDLVRHAVLMLRRPKVMCVRGRCRTINPTQNLVTRLVALERDVVERLCIYGAWRFGGFSTFTGGHAFFRREVFDEFGSFNEDILVEDIDMSVKLHGAGYEIAVVPGIQSWEEAPTSWTALARQRKRWTRGWIQVWRKHAASILRQRRATLAKRVDILISLTCSLVSGPLIALVPLMLLSLLGVRTSWFPGGLAFKLWLFAVTTPSIMVLITWLLDREEPEAPDWRSLLVSPLLVPYAVFMFGVSWICLIDEFVLAWPFAYVKTARAQDPGSAEKPEASPAVIHNRQAAASSLSTIISKRRIATAEPSTGECVEA